MKRTLLATILLFAFSYIIFASHRDLTHFSIALNMDRNFRVYLPSNYDSSGATRYPVIYYCHGCQGSYIGDSYESYSGDGGYQPPYYCNRSVDPKCDLALNKPFNADFQMFVDSHKVIIVMLDGTGPGGGCDAWYPSGSFPTPENNSPTNDFNFSMYIRDLIRTTDSIFPTRPSPQYRSLSGLSMGGHCALWLSAANPHLFRSASMFCASPGLFYVGASSYRTVVDFTQLWRNYRGIAMRASANDQDYLYQYSQEMGAILTGGAGFQAEYHLADFFRHWAADVDSQFIFHTKTFGTVKDNPACFSYINLYPNFDVWDYSVISQKNAAGWIYLKDVNRSGFGVLTREWLPYGYPCPEFGITVKTARRYALGRPYRLVSYSYRTNIFSAADIMSDAEGRITITGNGGMGEEFGISGLDIFEPAVAILADTLCENITIRNNQDTVISGDIVNLTEKEISNLLIKVYTETPFLTVKSDSVVITSLPGKSRLHIPSLAILNGTYTEHKNVAYIRVQFIVQGMPIDKEQIFKVDVADNMPWVDSANVRIFDGNSGSVSIFSGGTLTVSQGSGDGDGKPDSGEVISIWVKSAKGYAPTDNNTWHPTMPLNGQDNPDVTLVDRQGFSLNRGRPVLSGQFRLNRKPTFANPIDIPLSSEMVYYISSPGSAKGIDSYSYRYFRVRLPLGPIIGIEKNDAVVKTRLSIKTSPNPFTPSAIFLISIPEKENNNISLRIYHSSGRLVRDFPVSEFKSLGQGSFSARWNLKDNAGSQVSPGVYLAKLAAKDKMVIARVVFIR